MSYRTSATQNYTMIDDLPDLDDLEGPPPHQRAVRTKQIRRSQYPGAEMLPNGQANKFGKFIRHPHPMPREAGMSVRDHYTGANTEADPSFRQHVPMVEESYQKSEENDLTTYAMPSGSPSCLNVAEHVANCPICSKFYNDDRTIYIIAIIVLAVMCALLLKKVLDSN